MSKITFKALGIFILLLVASTTAGQSQNSGLVLNAVLPLTGSAALVGASFRDGLLAAETAINKQGGIHGLPVHMNLLDDESKPTTAVQLTNDLIAKHTSIIIGSGVAATCRAMMPLLEHGPVSYCLTNALDPPASSYVFASGASAYNSVLILYHYARARGWKRMATLTSNDATGQVFDQATAAIMKLPEFSDVSIVAEHFNPTDISVDAQMSHVRASNAQVIMAWTTGTPFGTIARAAKQFAPDLPIVTTAGNTTHVLAQYASVLPQELYEQQPPFIAEAVEQANVRAAGRQMAAALGKNAASLDAQTAWAWDAAMLVRAALTARGADASPDQLRAYLAQLKSFPGACGLYDFTTNAQRGLGLKDQIVARWQSQTQGWIPVSQLGGDPLKQVGLSGGD